MGVKVSLPMVFEAQTVAELAEVIGAAQPQPEAAVPGIVPVPRDAVPLSFAQERLWFLAELEPESAAYNLPQMFRVEGPLEVTALEGGLDAIVRRHEALRTTFVQGDSGPLQVVSPPQSAAFSLVDCRGAGGEREAWRLLRREAARPFDLKRDPLLRAVLVRLADTPSRCEHLLLVVVHHIACDFWSQVVFLRELSELYTAVRAERAPRLPELAVQYADFSAWQRGWLRGEVLEEQITWWREQLGGGEPPLVELPTDRPRPPVETFAGARRWFELGPQLRTEIGALSHEQGTTLFMTMLAVFQTLLFRYTGQTALTIGSPVAGRTRPEVEALIGVFINNLALASDLGRDPDFRQLLERARKVALAAFAHQDLPFEKLVEALRPQRDLSRAPVFQVMFVLHNMPAAGGFAEISDLRFMELQVDPGTAIYDLTLTVDEPSEGLLGWFEYNTDLFDASTIARMEGHFRNLLRGAVAAPGTRLSGLPLLAAAEGRQLLCEWNDTRSPWPQRPLHELVTAQAERTPEAVAVVFEGSTWTYRELDERSNLLAGRLVTEGVGPESLVGIALEPAPQLVVALLAVLKAGGVYLPLDPSYPWERLAYMLEDSGAEILITQEALLSRVPDFAGRTLCPDRDGEAIATAGAAPPAVRVAPESLAYAIYTSGSTGRPKGVEIPHRALVNFLEAMRERPGLGPADRVLSVTPLSFDIS
ncbi:MAG: AMP-binding protein, partial [bacterium]|nr:AMP-binding protein [bacterium]